MRRRRLSALLAVSLVLGSAACDEPAPPAGGPTGTSVAPPPSGAPAASADAVAPPSSASASAPAEPSASATQAAPEVDAGTPADAGSDAGRKPGRDAGAPGPADAGATPPASTGAQASADAGADAAAPALPPPAAGSADAVAAEVDAIYTNIGLYTARFKQEHTQKVANVVRKQSGTVTMQRPNRMSFRYDPPVKNRIVSDGTTLKIYVAEDEQMFVSPVGNSEYPGALGFLMGNGLRPSFTFTFNEKAKFEGGPVLLGKPRSPTPHYDYVMFYIDKALLAKKDPGTIRRVLIVDAQGNRNRFDFEDVKVPLSVDPAEFQFTPPAGTAVKQP